MPAEIPAPASARAPARVPGAKRARHKRWTRVATVVTVSGVVAFAAFLGVLALRGSGDGGDDRGTRAFLAGIAEEVRAFSDRKGRLPSHLEELFGPEGSSRFDAQIWDAWHKPFEYRVVDPAKGEFRLRSYGPDKAPDTADDIVWPAGASWR